MAVDRVDVADAPVIAVGAIAVVDAQGVAADVKEDAAEVVMAAENPVEGALGAMGLVKDVLGVQDVEDLVQAHAHQAVKDHLVVHAIVALAVLVHVHHVHHAADALDLVVAVANALAAMLDAQGLAIVVAQTIAAGAKDLVNRSVQLDVWVAVDAQEAVVDAQEAVVDVQDAVLDAMAHVLAHATGVVMDVVVDAKMHVQQLARRHALAHAKLKHLVP